MKIKSLRIQNFRSFRDTTIELNDYTCLVGPNGAGKSNVLHALNLFFREPEDTSIDINSMEDEDFHHKNVKEPVVITVTFTDLPNDAQKDLKDYYRHGQLVITSKATYDPDTGKAAVHQYGQRLAMKHFAPFFKDLGDKAHVSDLKKVYEEIRKRTIELPKPGTKDSMIKALREYESSHPDDCELLSSEDQFYGISKGKNRLERYIQWVYVPAVKDASTEQVESKNALSKLLARTVRAKVDFSDKINGIRAEAQVNYEQLLDYHQEVLNDISSSLQMRLSEWYQPDITLRLEWSQEPDKSIKIEEPFAQAVVGEGTFEGKLMRFGHGMQRSYIFTLLQELSGSDNVEGPRMILGCEEPELYQHPPQARHLFSILQRLTDKNSQVIISTHSPYFVSGELFDDIRLIRKQNGCSIVRHSSFKQLADYLNEICAMKLEKPEGTLAKVHQQLKNSVNEMFFSNRLVLVEGLEDLAYITTYLNFLDLWDDFRQYGCNIVTANGKSEMIRPLAIAQQLEIPTFIVFDSDGHKEDKNGSRNKHEKYNVALMELCGITKPVPFPNSNMFYENAVVWKSDISDVVRSEVDNEIWSECCNEADREYGQIGSLRKNMLHISFSLNLAWKKGKKSESLIKLCDHLIAFGKG